MKRSVFALMFVLACGTSAVAQTAPEAASPQAAAPAKPAPLGAWWLVNARSIAPLPERLLVHTEGQVSLSRTTGNVTGHTIMGSSLLALRHKLFTNTTSFSITVNELKQGTEKFTQEAYNLTNLSYYNVVEETNLAAGVVYERDDPKFVAHRVAVFGGVNQHLLAKPTHSLQVFGALGWEKEEGTVPGFDEDSPIAYVSEALTAQLGKKVTVRQALELMFDLKNSADQRRNFTAAVDLHVLTFLTVSPTFQVRYDGRTTPLAKNTDTMAMIALRFTR